MEAVRSVPRQRADITSWGMVPTPFTRSGRVDEDSLVHLASHYVDAGCGGLVVLGVIGEPGTLSRAERLAVARVVGSTVSARLVAGVMGAQPDEVISEAAALVGEDSPALDGLLVPVLDADPQRLKAMLRAVHDASGLDIIVQDLPSSTGVSISVDSLTRAVHDLDFVSGIKCEAPPTHSRITSLRRLGLSGLMSGLGGLGLVADLVAGAEQVAIGVTIPDVINVAIDAWVRGDDRRAAAAVGAAAGRIHFETQPGQSIAIRKEHLRRLGHIRWAGVRAPTPPWTHDLAPISAAYGVRDICEGD